MSQAIQQLYPLPVREHALEGLYLAHDLRQYRALSGKPFVYTNYVVSLDGRIAIPHPTQGGMRVPEATANPRDWRLFQELAVQADVLISTGRYLRDYAEGRAQEILAVHDDPRFADLKAWREAGGLRPQPDIAVISNSLDFAIPAVLTQNERALLVFTSRSARPDRIRALEGQGARVFIAGETSVTGASLVRQLAALGYSTVYSTAGPKVFHLLLADGVVDRLYLTHAPRILGGSPFSSIVEGDLLPTAADFRLHTLYFDAAGVDGLGQLFVSYDRAG